MSGSRPGIIAAWQFLTSQAVRRRWCALLAAAWFMLPGTAEAALVRFVSEQDTSFERRLAAEIASVGFDVEETPDPTAELPPDAVAVVYVRGNPAQVELWLVDEAGLAALSSVIPRGISSSPQDAATDTLQVAERLRALLQPLFARITGKEEPVPAGPRLAPPQAKTREAEPPSPRAHPFPRGSTSLPTPAMLGPLGGLNLAVGMGFGANAGEFSPSASVRVRYDFGLEREGAKTLSPPFGVSAVMVMPIAAADLKQGEDSAELEAWLAGAAGHLRLLPDGGTFRAREARTTTFQLRPGAGWLIAHLTARGSAASPRQGKQVSTTTSMPYLMLDAELALPSGFTAGASALVGLSIPRAEIQFAGEPVATWGAPLVLGQLQLGYSF